MWFLTYTCYTTRTKNGSYQVLNKNGYTLEITSLSHASNGTHETWLGMYSSLNHPMSCYIFILVYYEISSNVEQILRTGYR